MTMAIAISEDGGEEDGEEEGGSQESSDHVGRERREGGVRRGRGLETIYTGERESAGSP